MLQVTRMPTLIFSVRAASPPRSDQAEIWPFGPAGLYEVVAQPGALVAETFEELPALDRLVPGHVLVGADPEFESPGHSPAALSVPAEYVSQAESGADPVGSDQ